MKLCESAILALLGLAAKNQMSNVMICNGHSSTYVNNTWVCMNFKKM